MSGLPRIIGDPEITVTILDHDDEVVLVRCGPVAFEVEDAAQLGAIIDALTVAHDELQAYRREQRDADALRGCDYPDLTPSGLPRRYVA